MPYRLKNEETVLCRLLLSPDRDAAGEEAVVTVTGLIDRRIRDIQEKSEPLGRRLYAEKKKRFLCRFAAYWEIWSDYGN